MYTVKSFNDPVALQDYLNGVVLGAPLQPRTFGLDGLTFVINVTGVGDVTTTFADIANEGLSPKAILDAVLESASLEGVVALRNYGYSNPKNPQLAISGDGNSISKDGTANVILGFSSTDDTDVSEIATGNIVSMLINPLGPLYVVVLNNSGK
jgi:hypothetical protein